MDRWCMNRTNSSRLGMTSIQRAILRRGGIASTAHLLALDNDWEWINMGVDYGRLIKVCKGWWALPGIAAEVLEARRAGGVLACASALEFRGLRAEGSTVALHVLVPHTASRRSNATKAGRSVVSHYSRRPLPGPGPVVSAAIALEQAARCRALSAQNEDGHPSPSPT